jgi:Zn-dependent protease with chaperone function
MNVSCPRCLWKPKGGELWTCTCGHHWDTFATRGTCPRCGKRWGVTVCLRCHQASAHDSWYADEREALIARLEALARRNLPAYRRRVALLAAIGYAYIALVLVLTVALVSGVVLLSLWLRLAWFGLQLLGAALVFAAALLRGLWVRFPTPGGIPLDPSAHPALAHLVEEARSRLRAPRVHRMLLTGDLNAGVVQVPRLGLLGWPRNYLLLGLPLLDGFTVEETRAVVAHEIGHLSRSDGVLGGWIYRSRAAWGQLAERLQHEDNLGTAVLRRFFWWYQPYFDAYSFVAARAQEREADAGSALLAGNRTAADALVRSSLLGRALASRYWPSVFRESVSSPEPVGRPFVEMAASLQGMMDLPEAQASLQLALVMPTTHGDTHPCLRERLEALGEPPRLPPAPRPAASQVLLGSARAHLATMLDANWAEAVRPGWSDKFESMQRARKRLAGVDAEGWSPTTNAQKELELASLREELHGPAVALPYYEAAFHANPLFGPLRFAFARVLLEADRDEGLKVLEPLFKDPPEAVAPAHLLASEFFRRHGKSEEACRHLQQALRS